MSPVPGTYVHVFTIAGSRAHVCAAVYEPNGETGASCVSGHSSFTSCDAIRAQGGPRWLGRLGTRRLPPELDALPAGTRTRSEHVQAYHQAQYDLAYRLIAQVLPALAGHPRAHRHMGEVDVFDDPALYAEVRGLETAGRSWIAIEAPSP